MVEFFRKIIFLGRATLFSSFLICSISLAAQTSTPEMPSIPTQALQQSTSPDDITIKNANQTYYSGTPMKDGYTQAMLTGNVHIVFSNNDIYADEVIIKFLGGRAKVLIAKGQVLVKGKDRSTVAREVFVYVENKDIQFLDPVTLQNGIYVRGVGLRVSREDLTRLQDISMTTSTHYFPRYSIHASEGWLEQDNDFMLYGVYLQIGQDPLIYFPIFYNNHYGIGMITNITYDAYLEFMIFNTFTQKDENSEEKLMLDYYQKLGVYIGNDYSRTDIGNLQTHVGLAYDYHAQFRNGVVENVFEQILGEGPSVGRSLRYNFSVDYDKQLIQSSDPDGLSIQYKGSYKELSDPDFVEQFETDRYEQFNIKDLFFSDNTGYNRVQSANSAGTEGRRFDNTVTLNYQGYSLQLSSSMVYALNPQSKQGGGTNTFSPSYWHNSPSSQILPEVDLNKSYLFYTLDKEFQDSSKISMPIKLDLSYSFKNNANYQAEGLDNKDVSNYMRAFLSSNITYDTGSFFKLYFPISLENLFYHDYYQYYNYEQDGTLSSSNSAVKNTLTANYSPELTFQLTDTADIKNISTFKTVYGSNEKKTDNPNGNQLANDRSNTYNNLSQYVGDDLKFEWVNDDWEYLNGYVEGSYTYNYLDHSGERLPRISWYTQQNHAAFVEANFFETTIRAETQNTYGRNVAPEARISPLALTITTTSIPFVTISNVYTWDRYYDTPKTNVFSLTASIPSRLNITSWLWFSGVDITLDVNNNFQNQMLDYLDYKFSILFNITAYWGVEFFLSGSNQRLYLYGDTALPGQKQNFFMDLLKSFAFWSTRLMQESNFKMQNLGLTISHDLDEWVFKVGASLIPQVGRGGTFYFDTQFYAEVILKDLGMLSAPRMEQGSDNDANL